MATQGTKRTRRLTRSQAAPIVGFDPPRLGRNSMGFVVYTKPHGVVHYVQDTEIGIRRFHIPESRYDAPPDKPYSSLYGDPTILRLPDGRWVCREKEHPQHTFHEIPPRFAREVFDREGGFIEWLTCPWNGVDPPPIRMISEPLPEFTTDQAAFEARMSQHPAQPISAPLVTEPPANVVRLDAVVLTNMFGEWRQIKNGDRDSILRTLDWEPTRANYVHYLHVRVGELIDAAQMFDDSSPGDPARFRLAELWLAVYAVENLLHIGTVISSGTLGSNDEASLWKRERELISVLGTLPTFDRCNGPFPADAADHARRFATAPTVKMLASIRDSLGKIEARIQEERETVKPEDGPQYTDAPAPSENKATPTPETTAFPILLGEPEDEPIVRGKVKNRLTAGQYRVVKALIDAHPERLGKDTLARRSNTEDPIGMIDRLRKDADWESVLDKPGQAHGGYGIRVKKPRKPTPRKT